MSKFLEERVLSVHHWTDSLFSFKTTRNPAFRFRSGEFTMIGIPVNGKPLLRAYSSAPAPASRPSCRWSRTRKPLSASKRWSSSTASASWGTSPTAST